MIADVDVAVLGAGIAGLSTSHHLGHGRCRVFEAESYAGGHTLSRQVDGFVWDDGPHLSFTKDEYVRELLAESVGGDYREFGVSVTNYFRGSWITHPAQVNLHEVPEPLRTECVKSFLESRGRTEGAPDNYEQWLHQAFGPVFAETFPAAYTRKYWTREPRDLSTDWVSARVYSPKVEEVLRGAAAPLDYETHYITVARYPNKGGFARYLHLFLHGAQISFGHRVERIDVANRRLYFGNGTEVAYRELVSTIPLPTFIACCLDAPGEIREAAAALRCTDLLLVEVAARHPRRRDEHWMYVYDEDKYSTRINFTEGLAPANAPAGMTGLQVEVYGSPERPLDPAEVVAESVVDELVEMGLVDDADAVANVQTRHVPWANVIFDHQRAGALATLEPYLDRMGVHRAGRFAEWAYFWTDDCILSGRRIAEDLRA
jgi:protoporphyrinogen oxidase